MRVAATLAGVLLLLAASHGGLAATAQVIGYAGSAPPLSRAAAADSGLVPPSMAAWSQLPARLAKEHAAPHRALEYARWSRLLERQAEARLVLRALSRKIHSPWVTLALAELVSADGKWRDSRPPRDPVARLHLDVRSASRAILAGEVERSLAPLGRVRVALAATPRLRLPVATRLALARLSSVLDPHRARDDAWVLWRVAKRNRLRFLAAELQGIAAAVGEGSGSRVLLERTLGVGQRNVGAARLFPWLAQAVDAGSAASPVPGSCRALPADPGVRRFDCELIGFERSWETGRWPEVFRAYQGLERLLSRSLPAAQQARAGLAVLPLLKALGEWPRFQLWHGVASEAARLMRAGALTRVLTLELAAGLRVSGRYRETHRVLASLGSAQDADTRARVLAEYALLARVSGATDEARALVSRALDGAQWASRPARVATALVALDVSPGAMSEKEVRWLEMQASPGPVPGALWRALVRGRHAEARRRWRVAAKEYDSAWDLLRQEGRATVERAISEITLRRRIAERRAAVRLAAGRPEAALEAVEAGRETMEPPEGRWRHLAAHLGSRDLAIVYARVDDELWVWNATARRVAARVVSGDVEAVLALARIWTAAMRRGRVGGSWERIGRGLAEILVLPVMQAGWARGKNRLLVAPAAGLEEVPFDVLAELIEDGSDLVRSGFVTTASLASLDASWHRSRPPGEAVVFVPRTGSAAMAEARIVGAVLGGRMFLGREATKARFRDATPGASIVHFGGHSEAPAPLLDSGGLTLRPLASASGLLGYREIAGLDLAGTVIVLLGCDTAAGSPTTFHAGSHGVATSLTDAFFRAGTRAVVGNLWSIDDLAARDIAREFYSAGGPLAGPSALARTKRRLRHRYPDAPARWAGIVWQGAPPG